MLPSLERNTQVAQHYEAGAARSPDPSAHSGAEHKGGSAGGVLTRAARPPAVARLAAAAAARQGRRMPWPAHALPGPALASAASGTWSDRESLQLPLLSPGLPLH